MWIPLAATIVVPWTVELDTGYQEDHFNWRIQDKGNPSTELIGEKYSDIKFWSSRLRLYTVYRDLYVSVNFDYGVFGKGKLDQQSVAGSETTTNPRFNFTTTGHNYLAKITGGYQCNLTPMRYYQVILTPIFGYSLSYEKLRRKPEQVEYNTATLEIDSNPGEPLTMHWSGPFAGVEIIMNPSGPFHYEIGYAYNWLYVHQSIFSQIRVKNFDSGGDLTADRIITTKGKVKTGGALGQSGFARARYRFSNRWALGLLGMIEYRSSAVEAVNVINRTQNLVPPAETVDVVISRNYKSRWTVISALAEVTCAF